MASEDAAALLRRAGTLAASIVVLGRTAEVRAAIWTHREEYWTSLAEHIGRHLRPFTGRRDETARASGAGAGGGE